MLKINDNYIALAPSAQNAIDLFDGSWSSAIPGDGLKSGGTPLFDDARIHWLIKERGGLQGARVLELGPLEAGHTYMMDRAGAESITAIEANSSSYIRCLIVKEIVGIPSSKFLLGDFDKYISQQAKEFDLTLASGVLYHMADPLMTLQNIMRLSKEIFIWSHFFDDVAMPLGDIRRHPFTEETVERTLGADTLTYHVRSYGNTPLPKAFCGGIMSGSIWMEKGQVIDLLKRNGYLVTACFEQDDHQNGPAACLYAIRH